MTFEQIQDMIVLWMMSNLHVFVLVILFLVWKLIDVWVLKKKGHQRRRRSGSYANDNDWTDFVWFLDDDSDDNIY